MFSLGAGAPETPQPPLESLTGAAGWRGARNSILEELGRQSLEKTRYPMGRAGRRPEMGLRVQTLSQAVLGSHPSSAPHQLVTMGKRAPVCS